MAPLLAVDAPSLLYRSFFALPKTIEDGRGQSVNALLGCANYVLRVVADEQPRAVALCAGPDAAIYRKELYAPYHAHRPPVPDELAPQFEAAPGFFASFGWHWIDNDELEADDLLHSLAHEEVAAGGSALILTGDRDLFQCAADGVTVLYVRTGRQGPERIDAKEVRRRYGVAPELVPDFIALRGDPSDGLPGAKGIGEKRAADLLRRHGSLEAAIAGAVRERPASVCAALREGADDLRTFKDIATLRTIKLGRPADRRTDFGSGAHAAREHGMNQLAGRLEKMAEAQA
jgi:5'-3' exonuclease